MGIGGATESYSLTDNRFEIQYELDDLDIPLEYFVKYNQINVSSDLLENINIDTLLSSKKKLEFFDLLLIIS